MQYKRRPARLAYLAALLPFALAAPIACADGIRITEAVVDPQADHSESSGGNGAPYDAIFGNGTVSSVDEFVRLVSPEFESRFGYAPEAAVYTLAGGAHVH